MNDVLKQLSSLSPEKRALLARKLKEQGSRFNTFPLSFAQQRLWILQQFNPSSPAYNVPTKVRLTGRLDVAALEKSFDEIVRRHEILRMTFPTVDGRAVQVVGAAGPLRLRIVDLSAMEPQQRERMLHQLATEQLNLPLDLARGPLLRLVLYRMGEQEHVLLAIMHHLVCDGWSMGVLMRELATLYRGFVAGRPATLPELPIQYADFAQWQRNWLQGERLEKLVDYWREQLAGVPPLLELPTDRPRPVHISYRGAARSRQLPKRLADAVTALAHREGATPFMVLMAAWQTLLHRYSGQDDICVGTAIANRQRKETEPLIGFFVNTLAIRTDLSGDPTFRQLLGRLRRQALGAYAHQDLPFELLVERLQPQRNTSHAPVFQVMYAHDSGTTVPIELPGLTLESLPIEERAAKFDLILATCPNDEGLRVVMEYNVDLFNRDTVDRMLGHYETLLEAATADADQPVGALSMLTGAEEWQVVREWNDTRSDYPRDRCVHERFEEQALRSPDRLAIVFGDRQVTYGELNRRANQLASHLRKLGVGPEVLVGICMERSVELVVGILGILKAGGAYLPLDPTYPKERLGFMMADGQAPVLLTQSGLLDALPEHQARVVALDRDWEQIAAEPAKCPVSGTTAEHLAYVMYTSGSTGRPKGISIPHRAVSRLVINTNYVHLGPGDRMGLLSNIAFDAATFELWGALLNGGVLMGISREALLTPPEFIAQVRRHAVTTIIFTTALFNQLVRHDPGAFSSARDVLFGGEAADPRWVREVLQGNPPERLVNVYGPTENTTLTTTHRVQEVADEARSVSIGVPIANTQAYVLDRRLQPVPIGIPGELYAGGDGLARNYLRRPELTAENFVPNPFGDAPGSRLYKTGDLVRRLADGTLDFVARIDHQVKLRGFRIELGEIEAAIGQHPLVQEIAVLLREDDPGDKRLVAYLVPRSGTGDPVGQVRSDLRQKLPEYMIPATFVLLDALPVNANGKVDRKALPRPDGSRPRSATAYVAPRTPIEEILAGIWSEVLKADRIGVFDNFYDLGGHSLLAIQVASRIGDAFHVELSIRHLFETPTIAALADRLDAVIAAQGDRPVAPIERVPRDQALPLSFAQQRLWFVDQLEPGNASYNMPLAVRLKGRLNVAALQAGLDEIVRRHETLRTTFAAVDGQPVQVIGPAVPLALPVVDLAALPEKQRETEVRALADVEAAQPFDLERGPLLRAGLLRLADDEHVVLLTMHHIISDEWSLGVLIGELAACYEAFDHGRRWPLAELPIQYADFAHWQREWLQGEVLQRQLAYWRQQLAGPLPALNLPRDRQPPARPTYRGAIHSFGVPSEVSQALLALSRQEGATLFMTLLAALQTLLHRWTGQEDLVVGTDAAGRNRREMEGLIGFFVNHLVLRADLGGRPSFRQLLRRVRETTLGAYAHQDLPFDRLVSAVQSGRSASPTSLFEVLFVFGNPSMPTLALPELTMQGVKSDLVLSKYDLTLFMHQRDQEIRGGWRYRTEVFEDATVLRLADQFTRLLASIATQPDARLGDLEIASDEELRERAARQQQRQDARSVRRRRASREGIDLSVVDPALPGGQPAARKE